MHIEERLRHLRNCREPIRADSGTPYPCSQRDLDGYVRFHGSNRNAVYVSATTATNNLTRLLDIHQEPDASASAALGRIAEGLRNSRWGPDIVFKAFKDLDLAFFGGILIGNVLLKWKSYEGLRVLLPGSTDWGWTPKTGHGQCAINLNASVIFKYARDPFREMWRTMLHEMCVSLYPSHKKFPSCFLQCLLLLIYDGLS